MRERENFNNCMLINMEMNRIVKGLKNMEKHYKLVIPQELITNYNNCISGLTKANNYEFDKWEDI